jgi:hypothetical protein
MSGFGNLGNAPIGADPADCVAAAKMVRRLAAGDDAAEGDVLMALGIYEYADEPPAPSSCRGTGTCRCKRCSQLRKRERDRRVSEFLAAMPADADTHCKRGHRFTVENTDVVATWRTKTGKTFSRRCVTCKRENDRLYWSGGKRKAKPSDKK